jgi:hypothetical protein
MAASVNTAPAAAHDRNAAVMFQSHSLFTSGWCLPALLWVRVAWWPWVPGSLTFTLLKSFAVVLVHLDEALAAGCGAVEEPSSDPGCPAAGLG